HLLGDEGEEVDHVIGLTVVALAQHRVLRGHPDGARVLVAHAHHDAAGDDERGGREAELLGPEQGGDDHVPARLELTVDLDADAFPPPVEDHRLLRLGQSQLPPSAAIGAAMIASRPVLSCPSTWTLTRSRSPLRTSVCCASANPSSHGVPACLRELSGLAPVPPSWPEMRTTSAPAFATPAATVP